MKNYDFCFGCGFSCGVTQALRAANLQFASLPFDWTATPSFPKAARMAASDFAHWLDREDLELIDVRHSGINRRVYFNRRTGFGFVHDFSLFKSPDDAYAEVKAKYERRAERFRECLKSARTALAVCVEWPLLGRLRDETLAETKRVFETRFPGVKFDLLYFHVAEGASAAVVESERDGITVVGCEYRKYLDDGGVHHEIDNSQILALGELLCAGPAQRGGEAPLRRGLAAAGPRALARAERARDYDQPLRLPALPEARALSRAQGAGAAGASDVVRDRERAEVTQ